MKALFLERRKSYMITQKPFLPIDVEFDELMWCETLHFASSV